jgi:hypothetical protein
MEINQTYPIYRKLNNNRRFYKVLDSKSFEEIQVVGTKKLHQLYEAKQYPEILFIQDLVSMIHTGILNSSESEWLLQFEK